MTTNKDFIVLSNAEACIYKGLLDARNEWYEAIKLMERDGEYGYIKYGAMVDTFEKHFQTVRGFVSKAWNIPTATIDKILNNEYTVICEESIPLYNADEV